MEQLRKKIIATTALAFAVALGAGVWSAANVEASADADWTKFAISATSVRLGEGTEEDPSGLRFKVDCPVDYSAGGAECYATISFTSSVLGTEKEYSKDVPATVWRADGSGWNVVLLGIPANDYETEVTATAYVKVGDETYSTTATTSSIAKTATAVLERDYTETDSEKKLSDEAKIALDKFIPVGKEAACTYTFSNYTAGTQYADNEKHVLDDRITMYTTDCHFTSELRIYSSTTNNGYAILECDGIVKGLRMNAGYKADTVNVYGSNDGETWTNIGSITTTSSYDDYTCQLTGDYRYLKLDVAGTNQVRLTNITVTLGQPIFALPPAEKAQAIANREAENLTVSSVVLDAIDDTVSLTVSQDENITITWTEDSEYVSITGNTLKVDKLPEIGGEDEQITVKATVTATVSGVSATSEPRSFENVITVLAPTSGDTPKEETTLATFEFGANGSAAHKDGSTDKATYSETVGNYTLSITGGSKCYPSSYDAKGNSCIKLGTSSVVGSFTFTVPAKVTQVVIYVAKYKANTTKIEVNGTAYTLTKNSDDGEYDEIIVDTSSKKTVTLTTASGGVRAMVNSIAFIGYAS